MNTIKVFACDKAQADLFVSHLRDKVRRSGIFTQCWFYWRFGFSEGLLSLFNSSPQTSLPDLSNWQHLAAFARAFARLGKICAPAFAEASARQASISK
jgi:hypothetical protein